uniref:Putative secreted protein n=1 Tax=Ixodes ricinus TaxID=34613 RepID=V5IBA7_IXORI
MPKPCLVLTLVALSAMAHCMTIGNGYRADFDMQLVNDSCVFENLDNSHGDKYTPGTALSTANVRRPAQDGLHSRVHHLPLPDLQVPTGKTGGPLPGLLPDARVRRPLSPRLLSNTRDRLGTALTIQ